MKRQKAYVKPITGKHEALNIVQGSKADYCLYNISLYYADGREYSNWKACLYYRY